MNYNDVIISLARDLQHPGHAKKEAVSFYGDSLFTMMVLGSILIVLGVIDICGAFF
jgi:hypothetical protein